MAEPLAITTAIITLYSTACALKRYKDSYTEAPDIIKALLQECNTTLDILKHTKGRLDDYSSRRPTPNGIDIRARLEDHIAGFRPEVEALQHELTILLRPPATNYDHIKTVILKKHHVKRLTKIQGKIVESREQFDRLQRCLDGENIDWVRRNSEKSIHTMHKDSSHNFGSGGKAGDVVLDDATAADTERVTSEEGIEILFDAITHGREEDVKMILHMLQVSPNRKNTKTANFPLHAAIECGNLNIIEALLECQAEPNVHDKCGQTPLHLAARRNMKEVVQLLLSHKANPNIEDHAGQTPLWIASWYGDAPDAFELLIATGVDTINYKCSNPESDMPTALWASAASAASNHHSIASKLLEAGADPNIQDNHGSTLLHKAGWDNATGLAPALLAKNADVYVRDNEGKLPLHHAAATGKLGIIEKLLKSMSMTRNDAIEETDNEGATALIRAAQKGSLPIVRCLTKDWRAQYSVQDQRGNSPLYYACANDHILVVAYLAGLGADVNDGNALGNTPLHVAARWGYAEIVSLLLQLGAETDGKSDQRDLGLGNQVSSAEVARKAEHDGIAKMIESFRLYE